MPAEGLAEGFQHSGFTRPTKVVTMTTVGFGDFAPISTNVQKILAVLFIMLSITLLLGQFFLGYPEVSVEGKRCEMTLRVKYSIFLRIL